MCWNSYVYGQKVCHPWDTLCFCNGAAHNSKANSTCWQLSSMVSIGRHQIWNHCTSLHMCKSLLYHASELRACCCTCSVAGWVQHRDKHLEATTNGSGPGHQSLSSRGLRMILMRPAGWHDKHWHDGMLQDLELQLMADGYNICMYILSDVHTDPMTPMCTCDSLGLQFQFIFIFTGWADLQTYLKSSSNVIQTCCYGTALQCYRVALRPIHFVSANRHVQMPTSLLHNIIVYYTATMNRFR